MSSPASPTPVWRKSSRSGGNNQDCVEVATLETAQAHENS